MIIPAQRRWKTDYSSDVFGSIVAAQNINFDREGYLTLAPKPVSIFSQDDDAEFGRVEAIVYYDNANTDAYFIRGSIRCFAMTLQNGLAVTEITNSPVMDALGDAVVFNGILHFTYSTKLTSWDGATTFTDRVTGLTSGADKRLCVHTYRNELLVSDRTASASTVKAYDTSYSLQATLTIPFDYIPTSMRFKNGDIFIATRHAHGGEARVFRWNGTGTIAQASYGVRAPRVYSLCDYVDSIIAVTSAGQILRFDGGGFSPLKTAGVEASFPVWYEDRTWQDEDAGTAVIGKVLDRGTVADGDLLYINVGSEVTSNDTDLFLKNFPSGLWVYDPRVGLYPKALPSSDHTQAVSVTTMASSILTLASAVQTQTGEPILISAVGSITGISANATYYAIKTNTTTFQLALTPADAKAGTAITLGGSAGVASVTVAKNNQVGSLLANEPGAVALVSPADLTDSFYSSEVVWGVRGYVTGTIASTYDCLNMFSKAFNVGSFTTPKIHSPAVLEKWQKLITNLANINLDTDKIVIKYRTRERFGMPSPTMTGTYSSSTVLASTSNYFNQVVVGDEVVITKGTGAGRTAHVTEVGANQVTIDEAIPNASAAQEVEFYFSDFKKLGEITTSTGTIIDNFAQHTIDASGAWIQLKVELRGAEPAIEQLQVINNVQKPSV